MSSKVTAVTPLPSPAPPAAPLSPPSPLGEEQEVVTTFCTLLPKMPQWKFSSPSGFLSRSPSSASKDLSASVKSGSLAEAEGITVPSSASGSGLAAVLSACEPVCATPCSRLKGGAAGGRKTPRAPGPRAPGEEWSRKGSFISKPVQGWLHPDDRVLGPGVSYIVRYMGCIEILRSMRSLDFNTRTQVTKEAINRLYETVPGVRGNWKKKAPNKSLFSILGKSNLRFAGISIAVNISIDGLNLMIPTTRQIIANHHMQSISFASGGDTDTTDYVAYVAKDPINQRACHILECCDGLAQSIINTIGQAFELRFKQYLHSPPQTVAPQERTMGVDDCWGEEEDSSGHNYYNSIPGKQPPLGGLVDSRLHYGSASSHTLSLGSYATHFSQVTPKLLGRFSWCIPACLAQLKGHHHLFLNHGLFPPPAPTKLSCGERRTDARTWRMTRHCCDGYVQADSKPLGSQDYEQHMYVNTENFNSWETNAGKPDESPPKDLFDMRPFEDALKHHESMSACGVQSGLHLEDQWPSPPSRKAPIAPTEDQLKQELWYHGKMSRRDAEKLLHTDGDFLVRDSITNPGQYVLTGMHNGQPKHLLLVDPEGVVRTKDALFESISHLINYHLQNGQPIVAAESELHLRQVVRWKP
ncbi:SHC-transforming protein 2 [Pseudonaja textilis]|uniref:SHC-transforming protein 2 n=1 Tax=Pseudonaja textilis TaxID=8673 RepID=UPI000EA83DFF|nr:SHC-transforming protein 2 [Pseudonaja textilis]